MGKYIVTGASQGIGQAVAYQLGDVGHSVITMQRTVHRKDVADTHIPTDFESSTSVREAVGHVLMVAGRGELDGIVLNAGINERSVNQWDVEQWHRHMQINCLGQVLLMDELLKAERFRTQFSLVFVGSFLSKGSDRFPAYAMSKAAMQAYIDCLRKNTCKNRSLADRPSFNTIWPGRVDTTGNPKRVLGPNELPYKEPLEIAKIIVWLLEESDRSGINGQLIDMGA